MVVFFMIMKGDPPPLRQRRRASSPPTRRTRCCRPGCTRSCWSPSCTSRRCGRSPSPRRPGPTCSRASTSPSTPRRPTGCSRSGTSATSTSRSRCCTRRTARWSGRSSSTRMEIRQANPRGVVAVYIPEYVVGRWWEQLLHNQTALRLKGRLLFTPGVMVTSVPYQLRSSQIAGEREERERRPGAAGRPAPRAASRDRGDVDRTGRSRGEPAARGARARRPRGPVARRRAVRGRGRTGRARRALRRPAARAGGAGSSSCGTRSRGSGSSSRSPRAPRATGSGAATRSRCSTPSPDRVARALPVRRAGPVRRLRLPARRRCPRSARSRPTSCASSCPGWPGSTWTCVVEAVPGDVDGLRWRTRQRYVTLPDGRPRHAQAPLARRGPGRRLPARGAATAPSSLACSGTTSPSPTTASGRCTPGAAGAGRDRARPARARSRGRRCSTSTPASGCSPGSWSTRVGPARRVVAVEGDRAACRRTPRATSASDERAGRRVPGPSTGCSPSAYDEPFDLVVLDPPREGAKRKVVEQVVDRAPARRRVRRLRPGRARPRRRDLRRARLPARSGSAPSTCSR